MSDNLEELCINTIRTLSMDTVQKAKSGHPGTPMGAASMAFVLWDRFLKHNPSDPSWPDRDRFVLSPGHASALLYSLLHLTGYDLSLDDLKQFRQWESRTPGHPEYGATPGVELTTGPLGQGFATGIGMALAERWQAEHYNRPGHEIVDHYVYGIASDGDLQEGVASEAASLAGTLKLGKVIYLYDDNDISIEGSTDISFTENVGERFQAYGWHVVGPIDGMDTAAIEESIKLAQAETDRPSLIICRTIIGFGSPSKAGTAGAHGEPLGADEVGLAKAQLGWPYEDPFTIPPEALAHFRKAVERGKDEQARWQAGVKEYRQAHPDEAAQWSEDLSGSLPEGWSDGLEGLFSPGDKPVATREASGRVMNAIAPRVHGLVGGSADLSPSTKTILKDKGDYSFSEYSGHNLHFGVREHAMGAIANGMALHGGIIPYTATFLIFSDYMRPAIRLAALSGLRVIFVFTHDSVGLGEDGPTHQPIEHLMALRAMPNLVVLRPADGTETAEAWKIALERNTGPTALAFSRQNLPILDRSILGGVDGVQRGGYVLWESSETPEVILIGTGSELHIALDAGCQLAGQGVAVRVVSMPAWELFDAQPAEYREQVLPASVRARVSIEAGTSFGWERYVGLDGVAVGVDRFGASAPIDVLYERFGLTAEHLVEEAKKLLVSKQG
ncbi:MAG: transketolase [Chloroflexi bacterium]|jgi:transketolase|nr:MAG: transketolase [Chloroflexota bacterium]